MRHNGGHADELETSLMLYIAGERVLPGLAVAEDRLFQPGPLNRNRPDAANYTASGAMGDPTLASRAKGERRGGSGVLPGKRVRLNRAGRLRRMARAIEVRESRRRS